MKNRKYPNNNPNVDWGLDCRGFKTRDKNINFCKSGANVINPY